MENDYSKALSVWPVCVGPNSGDDTDEDVGDQDSIFNVLMSDQLAVVDVLVGHVSVPVQCGQRPGYKMLRYWPAAFMNIITGQWESRRWSSRSWWLTCWCYSWRGVTRLSKGPREAGDLPGIFCWRSTSSTRLWASAQTRAGRARAASCWRETGRSWARPSTPCRCCPHCSTTGIGYLTFQPTNNGKDKKVLLWMIPTKRPIWG